MIERKSMHAHVLRFFLPLTMLWLLPWPAPAQPPATATATATARYAPDSLLVRFQPGVAAADRRQAHRQTGARVIRTLPVIDVDLVRVPGGGVPAAIAGYRRNPNVDFAEPNYRRTAFRPATIEGAEPGLGVANNFNEQWGLHNTGQAFGASRDPLFGTLVYPTYKGSADADIDAPEAWAITYGSDEVNSDAVNIAVLDTGVACNHLDLAGKCVEQVNFVVEHGSPQEDILGHGTHVAGIAAAATDNGIGIAGVAREAGIGALKVCWEDDTLAILGIVTAQCDDADVADAILYAAGSSNPGYQVINISLAGPDFSATLEMAVATAWANGLVVVASAGNEYTPEIQYPAGYDEAIAVAASDQHDNLAGFSTFGSDWVSVLAPGSAILSTVPGGFCGQAAGVPSDCYDYKSGTSMAAPHVAGLAALLWSRPDMTTPAAVRAAIETGADTRGALGQDFGAWVQHGRIDMAGALAAGPVTPGSHSVSSVAVDTVNAGKGSKNGRAVVGIVDGFGDPLAGATVSGSFSGSYTESHALVTGADGSVTFITDATVKGGVAFMFCVDDVSHAASDYDAAANAVTCASF